MSKDSDAKIFSVIGGCRRSGRWLVPAKTNMLTLFGRAIIDLRQAEASAEELEFTCTSVFANITFIVPEGAEVRPSGLAILGSSRSVVPISDEPCDLPPISIDAVTIFGRMRVRTTDSDPEAKRKQRRFRRDKAPEVISVPAPTVEEEIPARESAGVDLAPVGISSQPVASTPIAAPSDLSSPIEPFAPAQETSPIHAVTVPETIEGSAADPAVEAPSPGPGQSVHLPDEPAPAAPAVEPAPVAPAVQLPEDSQPEPVPTAAAEQAEAVDQTDEESPAPPPVHLPVEGELIGNNTA